jgi:hypothetical protein
MIYGSGIGSEPRDPKESQVARYYAEQPTVQYPPTEQPGYDQYGVGYAGSLERRIALRQAIGDEGEYRGTHGFCAKLDLGLAAMSTFAAPYLEKYQTEAHHQSNAYYTGPKPWVEQLVDLPVDMKAAGVAVGAFAVTNAVHRFRKHMQYKAEADAAVAMINTADAFIPETPRQTFGRRMVTRAGRGLVTTAACAVAYKAGEQMSASTDFIVQSSLVATAGLGFVAAKFKAMRYDARKHA